MEEKDRFGDKLRNKQKADEDRFIAQQEQEKLARLREQVAKESAPRGLCPRDATALVLREQDGVTLDECPACKGLWMDHGELDQLLSKRKDEAWMTRWIRSVLEPHKS
ncbi:MAG TPA: zf-TFIIB domain-containing protein [Candidatus Binatia bacterium]|nr:zf-TFIIB domain-containing protein [Candidatus Binatia bacterium]